MPAAVVPQILLSALGHTPSFRPGPAPNAVCLAASRDTSSISSGRMSFSGRRGQGSVEYLFVIVFLVGFIVSVLVPSLREAEISYAMAGARAKAVAYEANHSELRLLTVNTTVLQSEGRVFLNASVYNRSSDSVVSVPPDMKSDMLAGIHALAPNLGVDGSCANTSNYEYCFVS